MIKVYDLSTDKTTLYSTINSREEGSCYNLQQEKIFFVYKQGFPDSKNQKRNKLESDKKKPSCIKIIIIIIKGA